MNIDKENFYYFQFSFIFKDNVNTDVPRKISVIFGSGVCRQKDISDFRREKIADYFDTKLHYHNINIFSWSKISKEEFFEFNIKSIRNREEEEKSTKDILIHSTTTSILL